MSFWGLFSRRVAGRVLMFGFDGSLGVFRRVRVVGFGCCFMRIFFIVF